MVDKSLPAHLRFRPLENNSDEKSLPATPKSSRAPELYVGNGIEVYHSTGLEPYQRAHEVDDAAPELSPAPDLVSPEKELGYLSDVKYSQDEKEAALVRERRKHIRRQRLRITIALITFLAVIAIAVGVGLGVTNSKKSSSSAQSSNATAPSLDPAPMGPPWNSTTSLTKSSVTPAQWRGKAIYQVLTDRFSRTDKSTTAACSVGAQSYCGGSWAGIMNNLDYIQDMGFTAIWISPVTLQLSQNTTEGEAYHGYWQQNIFELNSNFGNASDLQALSTAIHSRSMYLMVDVVVNHFGWAGPENTVNVTDFYPFNQTSYFHPYCPITTFDYSSNQTGVEDCWLGDSTVALADLDTTNDFVTNGYYSWINDLTTTFGIDGHRIDTVKHVQKSFWPGFNKAAGVFCMGEVFDGDPLYTCPYQDSLDSVLNYPLYYSLTAAFQNSSGDIAALNATISQINSACKDPTLLGNFIENHDQPRFLSLTSDSALDKNVIAFTILGDGIPIIYEGQEQGYFGGDVPSNREAIWTSDYSTKNSLYSFIGSVNQIRNQEIYKSPDYLTDLQSTIYMDKNNIAMIKGQIVGVYTNLGSNSSDYSLTLDSTGYAANTTVVEILSCSNITVNATGSLTVQMTQGLPRIFTPQSQLLKSGVCYL